MRVPLFISFIISILFPMHLLAQKNPIMPDTPPSPQAVAFNRLGDYEVNNNYGAPDINIPLWEIDFHGYKIPLSLHYEAKPLTPGYNYDVTGLGWTLSGNSCVSRTIKDRPDEYGRFSNPFQLDKWKNSSGQDKMYLDYEKELDKVNFQYDCYNIVLPSGRSIPFFIDMEYGAKLNYSLMGQDQNIIIECEYQKSPDLIKSFTVTDENGIKYYFTKPEKAKNIYQNDSNVEIYVTWLLTSIDLPTIGTITYSYTDNVVVNTQNLSREPVVTVCRLFAGWDEGANNKRLNVKGAFPSQSTRYEMHLLQSICYNSTTIDFNYIQDANNRPHMNEIVISDNKELIRKLTLNYDCIYRYDKYGAHLDSLVISGKNDADKLKYGFTYSKNNPGVSNNTPGVECTDYWGNLCEPGPSIKNYYGVTLNNHGLDNVGNFNMFFDHESIGKDWKGIQSQLSPLTGRLVQLVENKENELACYWKLKLQTTTDGDTRIPTSPKFHGVLTSITYPNGGSTSFNWENHSFPTATAADGDIVLDRRHQRIIEGGGFRIESIINWTADGKIANADYYRYGYTLGDIIHRNFPLPLPDYLDVNKISLKDTINHHIGCGEAVVDPNLFTFMSGYSYSRSTNPGYNYTYSAIYSYAAPDDFRKMLMGQDSRFKNITNNQGIYTWWEVSFSANHFRSLIGGRQPVVYPEITVYHGKEDPYEWKECKSKTVYRYDIYKYQFPNHGQSGNYLMSSNQTTSPDTAYFESLYFDASYPALSCREYPADRHMLKSMSNYSYNADKSRWELVSEEKYIYKPHEIAKDGFVFASAISRENHYPNTNGLSYGQIGYNHPLMGTPLRDFYKPVTQYFGKSELCEKSTTILRQGGMNSVYHTVKEKYKYYSGILKEKIAYTQDDTKGEKYLYVGEIGNNDEKYRNDKEYRKLIDTMQARNILTSIVSSTTYADNENLFPFAISGSKIDYASYSDSFLPSKLYEFNFYDKYHNYDEDKVSPLISNEEYEPSIEVLSYDTYGNPTEIYDMKTGVNCVFLWDEFGRYMTAMIKNAEYTNDLKELVKKIVKEPSQTRYSTLKAKFPKAMIQTWDYKPLIGVSSYTDATGKTILYEYDGLGRLISEKRKVNGVTNPETIREYEYNFINK